MAVIKWVDGTLIDTVWRVVGAPDHGLPGPVLLEAEIVRKLREGKVELARRTTVKDVCRSARSELVAAR